LIECIFTGNQLIFEEKKYALDHFVPHAFVSHDLIWNLIPIDKSFNSSKSDKLPLIDKYFDKFFNLQKAAFEIVKHQNSKNKFLEEYLTILPNLDDLNEFDYNRYKESIQPLITIASNNGFSYMKD
jgi:CRISPR/Cas system Type II protein with McrA/HNH and RuvC-like nuclease domain